MSNLPDLELFFLELKKMGIKQGDVASIIGITESYLSKVINGEKPMTDSLASALHKSYGKLLKDLEMDLRQLTKRSSSYMEQRRNRKLLSDHNDIIKQEGIPIYDVPIDAGFLERYREEEFHPLYYLNIPKLRNCDFGAIISGSSMYPIMKSGSIAMCRIIEDINYIDPGEMYLISTTNGFETVKYVQVGDKKDELKLIPHNKKIDPTAIKKSMIIRICVVEAWLNFR